MTHTNTQAISENFQSIKSEGGRRTKKIADIFKSAVSETMVEVKDGATAVRPLAKDLAGNAVQVVKEKGQAAYVSAKQAAQETAVDEQDMMTQLKLKLQAIFEAIKATLFTQEPAVTETVALIQEDSEHTIVTVESTADAV